MDDNDIMPFGKFKGRAIGKVPAGYLLFMFDRITETGGPKKMGALSQEEVEKVYQYMKDNHKVFVSEVSDYIPRHIP